MTGVAVKRLLRSAVMLAALASASPLGAQIGIGTWVRKTDPSVPGELTMKVEACCNGGLRLIYRISSNSDVLMTVESPMDGREVPVLLAGKPSGETMAIKRLDDHHAFSVAKMNGKPFGTSKSTLSADGKTLTVENDFPSTAVGQPVGKQKEIWTKK